MSGSFYSYGCTIGNQVIGTQNIGSTKEGEIAFVYQQLDTILKCINADFSASRTDMQKVLNAIDELKSELASKSPKAETLERSLSAISSISSVASLVDQIRPFLQNLF